MPAISSGDVAIIRKQARIKGVYVNIASLEVLATAEVATTPTWTDAVAVIATTNESVSWATAGNAPSSAYVRITRGTTIVYEGAERLTRIAGELRIAGIREGDTGRAKEIASSIQSGDTVTVYRVRTPFSFLSRIGSGGEFYKRWDVEYRTVGTYDRITQYPNPIGKTGTQHKHVRVPVGGSASVDYDASGSKSWSGYALSYTWSTDPTTGVTISPSATDTAVTISAPVGEYVVLLNSTEATTGRQDGQRRYLWVTDGVNRLAFNEEYPLVAIENDRQDRVGRSATFTFVSDSADAIMARLYVGAPFLLSVEHEYGSDGWVTRDAAPDGVIQDFFGYIESYELISQDANGVVRVAVNVQSPALYLNNLPLPQQTLIAEDPPTNWTEVSTTHQTLEHALYYVMEYHSAGVMILSDYDGSDLAAFKKYSITVPAGTIGSGCQKTAALCLGGNFGSSSDGRMWARRSAVHEGTTYRTNLANVWTWTDSDIVGELAYKRSPTYKVSELEGGGWVTGTSANPTAIIGRAGLYAPSQGVSKQTLNSFIGLSSGDVLDRVGHEYQRLNAPTPEISFDVRGGIDVVDPARMEWHTLAMSSYDPASTGVLAARCLPLSVERKWSFSDAGEVLKRITVTMQPETEGRRAPQKPAYVITPTTPTWTQEFDFTVSDGSAYGWQAVTASGASGALATYIAGVGWTTADITIDTDGIRWCAIQTIATVVGAQITSMEVFYSYTLGTEADKPTTTSWTQATNSASSFVYAYNRTQASAFQGTATSYTWTFSGAAGQLYVGFMTSRDDASTYTYSGSVTIPKIIVKGKWSNPF